MYVAVKEGPGDPFLRRYSRPLMRSASCCEFDWRCRHQAEIERPFAGDLQYGPLQSVLRFLQIPHRRACSVHKLLNISLNCAYRNYRHRSSIFQAGSSNSLGQPNDGKGKRQTPRPSCALQPQPRISHIDEKVKTSLCPGSTTEALQ